MNKKFTKIKNGSYLFIKNYFDPNESDKIFNQLIKDINWKQEYLNLFGKKIKFPRLVAFYGDKGISYRYSRKTYDAKSWNSTLSSLKNKIQKDFKINSNSVLLNLYRNGNDSMDWHQDDEKELGKNPDIISLNFGETRKFQLKNIESNDRLDFELDHGSILIMSGPIQHNWKHRVPKSKKELNSRINLTFRNIKN